MGILTGKTQRRGCASTWQQRLEVVVELKVIAEEPGCSLTELALAWVLMNRNVSALIMGA